jgi:hypothetical protein
MARAVSRKKGNRRVIRRAPLKKRVAKKRVQRKPRKVVHRKRAQPRRKIVQKRRKTRIAKRKVRKEPAHKRPVKRVIRKRRAARKAPTVVPPASSINNNNNGFVPPASSINNNNNGFVPPASSINNNNGFVPPASSINNNNGFVPPVSSIKDVSDPKRRKEIVGLVLEEIRINGGRDVMNRFRDLNGNFGLSNIALQPTASASGSYIGPAQVVYENEMVNVFIKMFISDDLREDREPYLSLLTEACISDEISQNRYSNIPTLMNSYGVLYSTQLVNDFYGNIDFNIPTHENVYRQHGDPNSSFHPVYLINERSDELGSPAITLNEFIHRIPISKTSKTYVKDLFFTDKKMNNIRKDVYSVFVQLLITLKLMHQEGLHHNDIHGGNVFVVRLSHPNYVTIGNITILTDYVIRVYDWDRGFSKQCNPLTVNKMMYSNICQSAREPALLGVDSCYQPHENISWGDFWLVIYTFILGNNLFQAPNINTINSRAKELITILSNMDYDGKFWSYNHGIDFNKFVDNLKPEYLNQIKN